ncbi:hypothetical protein [Bacillus alkalicellulosilyticus]|uniref:hypothetical protein n=1 Tax=Alkalihalobacterium alkalicellulosilyticum TaxID=1912214 RepID=UPI000996BED2|nr:hypothetical protein [Bacillus alkalicellulosilyticus]
MSKRFNKYPYIVLTIVHTIVVIITFYKKRNKKQLFLLLMSNIGLCYHFEYIVVNLFQGYIYKPNVLKNKQFDNILGAILSQAVYVPFTSILLTGFHLGWKAKWGWSVYFAVIETLFLKLGIYRHQWWRTSYTFLLLPLFFYISDKWYEQLKGNNKVVQYISMYYLNVVTNVNLLFILAYVGKIKFGFGTWKSHLKIAPIYSIVQSLFITWLCIVNTRYQKIISVTTGILLDAILIRARILKSSILTQLPFHFIMAVLASCYRKLVNNE